VLVAEIDWQALGAVATGAAAVVTAVMAVYTAKMARATKTMAEATQAQVALSRRQAAAAETSVEQAERTMGATLEPRLRVLRISGDQVVANLDDHFSITVVNDGPVSATINEVRVNIAPQFAYLDPVPGGAFDSGAKMLVRGPAVPAITKLAAERQPIPVRLKYVGQTATETYTSFALKRKGDGDDERWLIVEPESDKPHGSGVGSW
jgi:hypothetical protein